MEGAGGGPAVGATPPSKSAGRAVYLGGTPLSESAGSGGRRAGTRAVGERIVPAVETVATAATAATPFVAPGNAYVLAMGAVGRGGGGGAAPGAVGFARKVLGVPVGEMREKVLAGLESERYRNRLHESARMCVCMHVCMYVCMYAWMHA